MQYLRYLRRKALHNETRNRKRYFTDILSPHRRDPDRWFRDYTSSPDDGGITEGTEDAS